MKNYEVCREILNECSRNQMRDVSFEFVCTDNVDLYIASLYDGKIYTCEKEVLKDGSIRYHINTSGLLERYTFTEE